MVFRAHTFLLPTKKRLLLRNSTPYSDRCLLNPPPLPFPVRVIGVTPLQSPPVSHYTWKGEILIPLFDTPLFVLSLNPFAKDPFLFLSGPFPF